MIRPGAGVAIRAFLSLTVLVGGCSAPRTATPVVPSVGPTTRPAGETLELGQERPSPMYRELLAIDLPTVVLVARSQSLDIRQAKLRVEAAAGRYESSVGAIFPVVSPGISFEDVEGS